jgi:hypothetical protein
VILSDKDHYYGDDGDVTAVLYSILFSTYMGMGTRGTEISILAVLFNVLHFSYVKLPTKG